VPGLQQLFGDASQFAGIYGGVNGAAEALDLKLLTHTQGDLHGKEREHLKLL
jgi:hypothetical protein